MKKSFLILLIGNILSLSLLAYSYWDYDRLYYNYQKLYQLYVESYRESVFNLTLLMPLRLDEHYELIRDYSLPVFAEKGDAGWLLFYATQVLHDLGKYRYRECSLFQRTYGIKCDNLTVKFAEKILAYINRSYPGYGEPKQIYNWVNYFVSYVKDTYNFPRFPIETLIFRSGDCEDQAVALSFLLESLGYETALCIIHDKNLTEYGSDGLYHVFCVLKKENIEYNGTLIQLNRYPEYGKSWIILDPSYNGVFGEAEWTKYYLLKNGTLHIPDGIWDSIIVDRNEVLKRAKELGINL